MENELDNIEKVTGAESRRAFFEERVCYQIGKDCSSVTARITVATFRLCMSMLVSCW